MQKHAGPQCQKARCIELPGLWKKSSEPWSKLQQQECECCKVSVFCFWISNLHNVHSKTKNPSYLQRLSKDCFGLFSQSSPAWPYFSKLAALRSSSSVAQSRPHFSKSVALHSPPTIIRLSDDGFLKAHQLDRISRNRLLSAVPKETLQGRLECTPCAVPNNDLRFEINKLRSVQYAQQHGKQLLWCPAKDKPTLDCLRQDPSLAYKKKQWLQRHDKQCGGLQSMLPLVHGLTYRLADHLDRSKKLLKGTAVQLHSIELHPDDAKASIGKDVYILQHLPKFIYFKVPGATWKISDCAAGVFPLDPINSPWFLDPARKPYPCLKIVRRQLPIAPGFAVTIHWTQGQNLDPLLVDVCISDTCSRQSCYVALSRCKSREGIFLVRPFDLQTFRGSAPLGPRTLLQHLRREPLNWTEITEQATVCFVFCCREK